MRERLLITLGLLLFVAAFTYPVWHAAAAPSAKNAPVLKLPETEKQCVAPKDFMRAQHMQLLLDWREGVVRTGKRTVTVQGGRTFNVSLSSTCLGQCHEKEQFCDRCHNYAGVSGPYCWDCHNERKLLTRTASLSTQTSTQPRSTP
jgi:[DsrC]-trisulfide reductase subunit J